MPEQLINHLEEEDLKNRDPEQQRLMSETCILVDENDKMIGFASKKQCHLLKNIQEGMLHRAFSVFLFDQKGDLLLQKRAYEKITFPGLWTNTCCSHPLQVIGEYGENMEKSVEGVKRAAQRKLYHELGIVSSQVPLEKFHYLTRVQYKAESDKIWGENEIDYILFIQADVDLKLNPNEVETARYVSQDDLRKMLKCKDFSFTPWFELICRSFMFFWWDSLHNLNAVKNHQFSIIRM
ncbi:isopentenyl-diphosphate delta-isomerase [Pneumocystis jirovecii RU7]|uniref:isopentenyl-diphosphate Delta-isomerase n=1 Tax=Pneumocystis jirovecii (strain RU7) TaxID=1408657 RepID=A0A0W4ZS39_PNEJ7|nr:isopentenyl-diphosphate delta-isomerase [Pneumocystis jirovecii RU7]KTW31193.1 isopentenyl-diphosphate delta-isomerase [Pneumocystis jirovecii RU7]